MSADSNPQNTELARIICTRGWLSCYGCQCACWGPAVYRVGIRRGLIIFGTVFSVAGAPTVGRTPTSSGTYRPRTTEPVSSLGMTYCARARPGNLRLGGECRCRVWNEVIVPTQSFPLAADAQGVRPQRGHREGHIFVSISDHVHAVWNKALERRGSDAEGAITAARTLFESVCKLILDEEAASYDSKADLPALYSSRRRQAGSRA